jgi:tryptophan-rich sensory protein
MHGVIGLIISLLLVAAVAAIGGRALPGTWYAQLVKPDWTPPDWIFGPVWTLLYILMAVSAWLVWRKAGFRSAAPVLAVYLCQLILNGLWSWVFFNWHRIGWALIDIAALWATILTTVIAFWRIRPVAGGLFLPYLAWVSFAAILNFELWRLNR